MTNEEIEKIAKRVSELVLDGILQSNLVPFQDNDALKKQCCYLN